LLSSAFIGILHAGYADIDAGEEAR